MKLHPDLAAKCEALADAPAKGAKMPDVAWKPHFVDPLMSEGEFLGAVIQYARERGWRVAHFRPARTASGWRTAVQADGKGFPDLVLARPPRDGERGRVVFVELKSETGRMSPEQQTWCHALLCGGAEYYSYKPKNWFELMRDLK